MATLYYNNGEGDNNLGNYLNWWSDASCTVQADAVPLTGDSAVILANAVLNDYGEVGGCSPDSMVISNGTFSASISCSGGFEIIGAGVVNGSALTGNVTASGNSVAQITGTTITGNLTFAGSYTNALPDNAGGTVSGATSFSGTVIFSGANNAASPTWTDAGSTWTFSGRANSGTFTCAHCAMTNSSTNSGEIIITGGNIAAFDGGSTNESGLVTGNASFEAGLANQTGEVTGDITIPSTHTFTQSQLGTFGGVLRITAPASGGGSLGGPGIEF